MKQRRGTKYLLLVGATMLIMAGCGNPGTAVPAPEPGQMQDRNMQDGMMQDQRPNAMTEEAIRISEMESDVQSAHAITHDTSTLIVGLILDEEVSDEERTRLERDLEQRISEDVEGIDRVVVTADRDEAERIRDMESDVRGGMPMTDLADDTEDMFERLTNMRR